MLLLTCTVCRHSSWLFVKSSSHFLSRALIADSFSSNLACTSRKNWWESK